MKMFGALSLLLSVCLLAEESNLPPDPFAELAVLETAPDYTRPVDRTRGSFRLEAADGKYVPGDHFAHWYFSTTPQRWGNYFVNLHYFSKRTKLGVQVKVGDLTPLKTYAPRTGGDRIGSLTLGTVHIPRVEEYPVVLLSGDQSDGPDFRVEAIEFVPAPEGDSLGQSIDGSVTLHAGSATTYSERMRYEPADDKQCLGFWTDPKDWAEWVFEVTTPGTFEVQVHLGCGEGSGGSEVALLIDDQTYRFTVEETGGFQNWSAITVGTVEISLPGPHKLALIPESKAGKAIMDVRKVVLTPVNP